MRDQNAFENGIMPILSRDQNAFENVIMPILSFDSAPATDDDVVREFNRAPLPSGPQALLILDEVSMELGDIHVMCGQIKSEVPDDPSLQRSCLEAQPIWSNSTMPAEGELPGSFFDDRHNAAIVSGATVEGASKAASAVEAPESPTTVATLPGIAPDLLLFAPSAVIETVPDSDRPILMLTDGKTPTDPKTALLLEPRTRGPKSRTLALNRTAHRDSQQVRVKLPKGSGPQVQRWELTFVSLKGTKVATATKGWKKIVEVEFSSENSATTSFDIEGLLRPFQPKATSCKKKAKATPNQWREDGHFVLRRITRTKGNSRQDCFHMTVQLFARSGLAKRLRKEAISDPGWTPPQWGPFAKGLPPK
jgi:hypothetical protein